MQDETEYHVDNYKYNWEKSKVDADKESDIVSQKSTKTNDLLPLSKLGKLNIVSRHLSILEHKKYALSAVFVTLNSGVCETEAEFIEK